MKIANPVYDTVFKYLMEDERIARTILSALLKKDVVAVEVRPHEYSNDNHDSLSVFRIDFGATIRDAEGKDSLLLIELQKTWLETETLRFRQYLGVHYSNPKNIRKDGNALPMVAVYLLGHRVGDIEEPVIYVNKQICSYDSQVVTKGLPNSFVESLTHDSIIVQIPRLHGQINNRLDMVLSIFDQSRMDENDSHVLKFEDEAYDGDADMTRILHRLTMAAADADMRHKMNVEDEYFSAIEKRDTEILLKDRKLAEQNVQLMEQQAQLNEQQTQLNEQQTQLNEQQTQLNEQQAQLTEQQTRLTEQQAELDQKDELLRMSVRMLLQAGKSVEEIAASMGMDLDIIRQLAE